VVDIIVPDGNKSNSMEYQHLQNVEDPGTLLVIYTTINNNQMHANASSEIIFIIWSITSKQNIRTFSALTLSPHQ